MNQSERVYRGKNGRQTSICPEQYIILRWIISAFEEIKEMVPRADVDVSCIRADLIDSR